MTNTPNSIQAPSDVAPAGPAPTAYLRLEGPLKVTGRARYAADLQPDAVGERPDVAVAVTSSRAAGRISGIDVRAALAVPGVRLVLTHENAPRLHKVTSLDGAEIGDLLPLQDDRLHYNGQCVAVVVGETPEAARDGARLVAVRYSDASSSDASPDRLAPHERPAAYTLAAGAGRAERVKKVGSGEPGHEAVGDADAAYAAAAQTTGARTVDRRYETSPHHHNAMEPGAAVARWDADGGLTVQLPSQFSYNEAIVLGQAFGFALKDRLPRLVAQVVDGIEFDNKVRVISTLAGGAFGGKKNNVHLLLVAMAAKLNGRAVKLVLTRAQTFTLMPYRGETHQRVRLAAGADGALSALIHEAVVAAGAAGQFLEPVGELTAKVYACDAIRVDHEKAALDLNAPGWMRGPGSAVGQFAVESAVDELAESLGVDPLDFRLRNYAEREPGTGHEWSSKSLRACYEAAAERIGWRGRDPRVGGMREGGRLVGYGMATAMYPTQQTPTVARVAVGGDGVAVVQTATHEIGQGMITALAQIAAESLGFDLAQVRMEWGDTCLPYGGVTAGSMTTLSSGASIADAAEAVRKQVLARAVTDSASPLYKRRARDLTIVRGAITALDGASERVADLMRRHADPIQHTAVAGRTMGRSKYARNAFGAQFVKVAVDPDTLEVRVRHAVGAFAAGRIVNPITARSQLMGAMVWGIGQALMEASHVDERSGRWMNPNLAEALVPTHADIPAVDVLLLDEDDTRGHPLGVKGLGEIGVVGMAAAIANAIHHATGVRLRALPMRLDHLLSTSA